MADNQPGMVPFASPSAGLTSASVRRAMRLARVEERLMAVSLDRVLEPFLAELGSSKRWTGARAAEQALAEESNGKDIRFQQGGADFQLLV